MATRTGSKTLIREINEALVLDAVRKGTPIARGTIAERTGLSHATVTGIVGSMLRVGLVVEAELTASTGGRPARLVALGRTAVFAVGVRLSPTSALAVLVDLAGDVVATHAEPADASDAGSAAEAIAAAVEAVVAARPRASILGVGIAVSGVVDHELGIVRHSGTLGWVDEPFAARAADRLRAPVAVDSHVNALTTGRLWLDRRLDGRDLLMVSVGQSIGAAVVLRGSIHRGFSGAAGGFAHWHVGTREHRCHCGADGCLEAVASGWALDAADAVDEDRIATAAAALGIAVANAAKMLGPEIVRVAVSDDDRLAEVVDAARASFDAEFATLAAPAPAWEVAAATPEEVARGAACIVLADLVAVPGVQVAQPAG